MLELLENYVKYVNEIFFSTKLLSFSSCEYLFHKYLQIQLTTRRHNYLHESLNQTCKLLDNIHFKIRNAQNLSMVIVL